MTEPILPNLVFSRRFCKTSRYAFYMQNAPEETFETVDSSRYITLDVNPQQISMREPMATAIQFTQGGGKIRESRGGLVKPVTLSGTTGYTPLPSGALLHHSPSFLGVNLTPGKHSSLVPDDNFADVDSALGSRSGFYAFHRLRYLFRLYAYNLQQGNTKVTLHYVDTKNDEYWRIEPQEFVMQRSSRKPFSYDYSISFQCLEESGFGEQGAKFTESAFTDLNVGPGVTQKLIPKGSGLIQTINRFKGMLTSGLNYTKHLSGVVEHKFQTLLRHLNSVVGYVENIHATALIVAEVWHTLLKQLDNSLAGMFNTYDLFAADNIQREINEWCLETQWLNDHLRAYVTTSETQSQQSIDRMNGAFSAGRLKNGSTTDLLTESSDSTGSPDVNPFIGRSGLQLVTNMQDLSSVRQMKAVVVYQGDTIQSLAIRLLGDVQRFIDLVLLNNLDAPYIVADADNKPSNTIAWGEYIQIPANATGTTIDVADASLVPTFASSVTRTSIPVELIDESLTVPWRDDQWIGYTVTLTQGVDEYTRVVVGNTGNTITVNFAWAPTPAEGDTYEIKMVLFDIHRPLTPEAKAYGTDLLLKFTSTGNNQNPRADLVIDSSGGLARVRGLENLIQALMLRLNMEQKRHPFHPSFGAQVPIGQSWNDDMRFLYTFFIRKSIFSDPRVQAVRNARLEMQGDTVSFIADVQPINTRNTHQISSAVR